MKSISERIKIAIVCRGITQKKLAEISGVSENSIVHYLKNRVVPPIKSIDKIARACFIESEWLIGEGTNIAVLDILIESINKIKDQPIELIAHSLEVSVEYFNKLVSYEIMPSMEFIYSFYEEIFGKDDSECSESITKIMNLQNVVFRPGRIGIIKKHNPHLVEIIDLLKGNAGAQDIVLSLLHSLEKQAKKNL